MRSQFIQDACSPHLENDIKLYLLLLSQLSELNHIISVIYLLFCIEIILMLDVAVIVN